jgi:PIN domain nuclease of toxin-antitoxin system
VASISRALLDTHIFLWSAVAPERLKPATSKLLQNTGVQLYLSVASVWELAVKHQKGKLEAATDLIIDGQMKALSIAALPIALDHVRALRGLGVPDTHMDPFDRILAAQAMAENLPLVTYDPAFREYEIDVRFG